MASITYPRLQDVTTVEGFVQLSARLVYADFLLLMEKVTAFSQEVNHEAEGNNPLLFSLNSFLILKVSTSRLNVIYQEMLTLVSSLGDVEDQHQVDVSAIVRRADVITVTDAEAMLPPSSSVSEDVSLHEQMEVLMTKVSSQEVKTQQLVSLFEQMNKILQALARQEEDGVRASKGTSDAPAAGGLDGAQPGGARHQAMSNTNVSGSGQQQVLGLSSVSVETAPPGSLIGNSIPVSTITPGEVLCNLVGYTHYNFVTLLKRETSVKNVSVMKELLNHNNVNKIVEPMSKFAFDKSLVPALAAWYDLKARHYSPAGMLHLFQLLVSVQAGRDEPAAFESRDSIQEQLSSLFAVDRTQVLIESVVVALRPASTTYYEYVEILHGRWLVVTIGLGHDKWENLLYHMKYHVTKDEQKFHGDVVKSLTRKAFVEFYEAFQKARRDHEVYVRKDELIETPVVINPIQTRARSANSSSSSRNYFKSKHRVGKNFNREVVRLDDGLLFVKEGTLIKRKTATHPKSARAKQGSKSPTVVTDRKSVV